MVRSWIVPHWAHIFVLVPPPSWTLYGRHMPGNSPCSYPPVRALPASLGSPTGVGHEKASGVCSFPRHGEATWEMISKLSQGPYHTLLCHFWSLSSEGLWPSHSPQILYCLWEVAPAPGQPLLAPHLRPVASASWGGGQDPASRSLPACSLPGRTSARPRRNGDGSSRGAGKRCC